MLYTFTMLTLILVYQTGYQMLAKIALCFATYGFSMAAIHENSAMDLKATFLICTVVFEISVGGSLTLRHHFLYEGARWTLIILTSDILFFSLYAIYFFPSHDITLSSHDIHKCMFYIVLFLLLHLFIETYFDGVRQSVFNELKRYSDELERNIREKEVFFACMSHEIRNPLQSLIGAVELFQNSPGSQAQRHTCTAIIKNGCEMVLSLVANILDVAKIEAQKMELALIPCSLGETLGKVVRLLNDRAAGKRLVLKFFEHCLPPCISLDPHRLQQVVLNLVSNAIKFTASGEVVVTAKWLPVEGSDDELAAAVKKELTVSDWKTVINPLREFEDGDRDRKRRLQVGRDEQTPPSDRRGRPKIRRTTVDRGSLSSESGNRSASVESEGVEDSLGRSCLNLPNGAIRSAGRRKANTDESIEESAKAVTTLSTDLAANIRLPVFLENRGIHVGGSVPGRGLVKIEVMDTGIGIRKEHLGNLFQPFQQADSSISRY